MWHRWDRYCLNKPIRLDQKKRIYCDKIKSDFCTSSLFKLIFFLVLSCAELLESLLLDLITQIVVAVYSLNFSTSFVLPTLSDPWPCAVTAPTTSLCFINKIFIQPRKLIIQRYNPESDIRQSPWNNHFPFAHNTLIIHVFPGPLASPSMSGFLSPTPTPYFPHNWSAQHLEKVWCSWGASPDHALKGP